MSKKIISLVLSLCLVLALMPMTVSASGTADTSWYDGHEDDDVFYIGTADELAGLAVLERSGANHVDFTGKTIYLTSDIDLSQYPNWEGIGGQSNNPATSCFAGIFDGQNHVITGLQTTNYGLFSWVTGGTVKNLIIIDAQAKSGIVAGTVAAGVIENCHVSGNVYNTATVGATAGGVVGSISGTMDNCTAFGTVRGNGPNGGLAGVALNSATVIKNSAAFNYSVNGNQYTGPIVGNNHYNGGKNMGVNFENIVYYEGMTIMSSGTNPTPAPADTRSISIEEIYTGGFMDFWPAGFDLPNYLPKPEEPIEYFNRVGLYVDESTLGNIFNNSAGFSLTADFQLDMINLVEARITYNPEYFDATANIPLENAIVKIQKIDEEWGFIDLVIGVQNEGKIAYEQIMNIAQVLLTAKEGLEPEYAAVNLASIAAWSKGELVELIVSPEGANALLTYRSILDVNGDGMIDLADLSLALYYFGAEEGDLNWDEARFADVNGDGVVDMLDITILIETIYGDF